MQKSQINRAVKIVKAEFARQASVSDAALQASARAACAYLDARATDADRQAVHYTARKILGAAGVAVRFQ